MIVCRRASGRWIEYAGGYTDMLAQRGCGVEARPGRGARRARRGTGATLRPPPRRRKRKLSFKEQHALETLPARIAALEAEIARLQAALADPDLYAATRPASTRPRPRWRGRRRELAAAEERWLELELLREELES